MTFPPASDRRTVSVVTSLYGSGPYVFEFYHRTKTVIDRAGLAYEFIFVDDGSPDDCAAKVRRLREDDSAVHLLCLSRSHGQQRAMLTGLQHARGDLVYAVDVDLEEKPEDLARLLEVLQTAGADMAYGVMIVREGGFVRRTLGHQFHRLMTVLSSIPIPENQLWSRVMTRRFVDGVCRFNEQHLYLGAIFQLVGFRQVAVPLEKTFKRSSSYDLWKRLVTALDALTSFSVVPLYALCVLGLGTLALCGLLISVLTVQKLVFGISIEGWTTLAVLLLAFMGAVMFAQGIIGVYVGKIFAQVKERPGCIIESSTLADVGQKEPAPERKLITRS
jgi:putative glycosyltransferase